MPATDPIAEVYMSCAGVPCTLGTLPMSVESGGFKVPAQVDEMTSSAYYDDVQTIQKATFSLKVAYKLADSLAPLHSGGVYPLTINYGADGAAVTPGAGPSFKGNVRVSFDDLPVLDRKNGVHLSISGTSNGTFVYAV